MAIYRIADLNIKINNRYRYTTRICEKYRIEDDAEVDFEITPNSDDYEKDLAVLPDCPEYYLESLSIHRQISKRILDYDGIILHACVIEMDGKAYAFSAPSGTGKSTHAKLWLSAFGDRARIINGDKPLIRLIDGKLYIYGTPWCGKEGYNINTKSSLTSICFLARGKENRIEELTPNNAVPLIFTQLLMPEDEEQAARFFGMLDKIFKNVRFYRLFCNMDIDAAICAYEGMKEK